MSLAGRIGIVFARKWIGGVTILDVLRESKRLNRIGERVVVNYLGEEITGPAKVEKTTETYIAMLNGMDREGIMGSIAVKPTQLGLNISYRRFLSNYTKIVAHADRSGRFVWMDMEDYTTVDSSIKAYLNVIRRYGNIGICIQAKLLRSLKDVKRIVKSRGVIRLVKGAYPTRDNITYRHKSEVDNNYIECMEYLFKNSADFMIATHDERMIDYARKLERKCRKKIMFGMLKGIRPRLALDLASKSENIYIYVPFGDDWLSYSLRRLKELENSSLIVRSIISG